MAEALGVAASAIAVVQVASSAGSAVLKLKGLWDQIQDVPETIQDLMLQIEILDPLILEMETELRERSTTIQSILFDDTAMRRSTEYGRKAMSTLNEIVSDLSARVNTAKRSRRIIAKVKVVINARVLEQYEKRLRTAVSLVNLAQQRYVMALTKIQPHVIVGLLKSKQELSSQQQLLGLSNTGTDEKASTSWASPYGHNEQFDTSLSQMSVSAKTRNPRGVSWEKRLIAGLLVVRGESEEDSNGLPQIRYTFRLWPPSWLIKRAWDFQCTRAIAGWTSHLRSWRTVARNSPTMIAARTDNTAGLMEIFRNGLGSPFDRDEKGMTLLHNAAYYHCFDTIKLLLASGLRYDGVNDGNYTSTYYLFLGCDRRSLRVDKQILRMHDCLEAQGFTDVLEDDKSCCMFLPMYAQGLLRSDLYEAFELTKKHLMPYYRKRSPKHCLWNLFNFPKLSPIVVRECLGADIMQGGDLKRPSKEFSVAHILARCLAARVWPIPDRENEEWRSIFVESGVTAYDLFTTCSWYKWSDIKVTPFIGFLHTTDAYSEGRHGDSEPREPTSSVLCALRGWLSILQSCGVNLEEYGRKEQQMFLELPYEGRWAPYDTRRGVYEFWREGRYIGIGPKLKRFTYGPNLDDWSLVWDMDVEEFLGEFWDMIDETRIVVPGALVD